MPDDSGLDILFYGGASFKSPTLERQIEQIISERGLFRTIREKDLEHEVQKAGFDAAGEDATEPDGDRDESEDESLQVQQDKLWKSRDDMVQKLSFAQNEVLSALDFISLLLSNHNANAQTTMSPALKELVPPKTLDCRTVENEATSAASRPDSQQVSDGWKAESFHTASTKLSQASLHLREETEGQGKYWDQVAQLKARGWSVSRLPTDSQAIGVHIGLQESAAQFRARGFALLQQDRRGNLHLDPRLFPKQKTTIVVEIIKNGITTGSHAISPKATSAASDDIESHLTLARDALLLEELFYELSREARHISNQSVRFQQSYVEADIAEKTAIRITRAEVPIRRKGEARHEDDNLAQITASCLQMLLLSEHTRLHLLRSRPPPPITSEPPPVPELAVLRPILAQLRHEFHLRSAVRLCQYHIPSLRSAGVKMTMERRHVKTTPADSGTFASLRQRVASEIVFGIATGASLVIKLETYLATPIYGTTFTTSVDGVGFVPSHSDTLNNFSSLHGSIADFLTLALLSYLRERLISGEKHPDQHLQWTVYRPHSGEMVAVSGMRNVAKIVVGTDADRVFLHSISMTGDRASKPQRREFTWTSTGLESDRAPSSSEPDLRTMEAVLMELDTLLHRKT